MVCGDADCCATGIDGGETKVQGAGLVDVAPPVSHSPCPWLSSWHPIALFLSFSLTPEAEYLYTLSKNTDARLAANPGQYSVPAAYLLNAYHLVSKLYKRAMPILLVDQIYCKIGRTHTKSHY